MRTYLKLTVDGLVQNKDKWYSQTHKPVFRGISSTHFDPNDYKQNSIGFWPCFTSTSTDIQVAEEFSDNGNFSSPGDIENKDRVIFKIYLTSYNYPRSAIDLPASYTFIPREKEVLLMPHFPF